jgi:F-type H+-transporting ATPase subunit b
MHIDGWTLALQTINVLVLIWILSRFLFRPVAAIVAARQAEIARLLEEARAAKVQAEVDIAAASAETRRIAAARNEALQAAAGEAEAKGASIVAAAHDEAEKVLAAARANVAQAQASEAKAAGDRASLLAVEIAAKLFGRLPEDARVAGFIDGLAAAVHALPEATRAAIGASTPVHLKAARPLTEAEVAACRAALAHALGRDIEISADSEPGLIAGFEIDAPHALVRNSFRADLERIAADLTSPDHDRS